MGFLCYADDLILCAPSLYAARYLLETCETWAQENGVVFSTDTNPVKSKYKVMLTNCAKNATKPVNLQLYGRDLPYEDIINHLGHLLDKDNSMIPDTKQKKAILINMYETRDLFCHLHPREQVLASKHFCSNILSGQPRCLFGN